MSTFLDNLEEPERNFLLTVNQRQTVTRDAGATYLSKYGIPAEMWRTWAAAAGLPGARYEDPQAAARVAAYAAKTLYNEFGNWGMVAIGWRYGAGTARRFSQIYGGTPAGDIIQKVMGTAGATFVDKVTTAMSKIGTPPPAGPPSGPRQAGEVELRFKPEEAPEPATPQGPNPAHSALIGVLTSMANRTAGGNRLSVEDAMTQMVPEDLETEAVAPDQALIDAGAVNG